MAVYAFVARYFIVNPFCCAIHESGFVASAAINFTMFSLQRKLGFCVVKVIVIPCTVNGMAGGTICFSILFKLASVYVAVAGGAAFISKLKLLRFYVFSGFIPKVALPALNVLVAPV
jgi:hypothetical protein